MIKMKYSSIVINILVLFLYSCVYGQDTLGKNDNPAEEVHFKKLNEVQGKYLHWIDKKTANFRLLYRPLPTTNTMVCKSVRPSST